MTSEPAGTLPVVSDGTMAEPYKPGRKRRTSNKRKLLYCCSICCSIVIVLLVILIILIFTVFKQKDPRINVDSIALQSLKVNLGNLLTDPNISVDADLITVVSIKNPNYAGFAYGNSTAYVTYHGQPIAQSPVPAGSVRARRTVKLVSTTSVHVTGALLNANLTHDLGAGVLPMLTTVQVKGTAKVFGAIHIKHVKTSAFCNLFIYVQNQTQSFYCNYKVKL